MDQPETIVHPPFELETGVRKVFYGRVKQWSASAEGETGLPTFRRCPVTMQGARLDDDLLAYLQAEPMFNSDEASMVAVHGFNRCIDHPGIPGHIYYEAYRHGLPNGGSNAPCQLGAADPRTGRIMDKPAAPLRFRAFLQAFRDANSAWLRDVLAVGFAGQTLPDEMASPFVDIAVQSHHGEGVPEKHAVWHSDAPNSLLHMAVSLRGKRTLHCLLGDENDTPADCLKIHAYPQHAGCVYVSSPFGFEHAVEYSDTRHSAGGQAGQSALDAGTNGWEDRILAVQCRFSFSQASMEKLESSQLRAELLTSVTEALSKAVNLQMPSLQDVKLVQNALEGLE